MTEYFTTAIIWSAMGLIVGFLAGVGVRVTWLNGFLGKEEKDRVIGLTLILIGLVAVAQNLVFQKHQREITNCQTQYNVAFQTILKNRSDINDRDKDNLSSLMNAIGTAKTKAESRTAFDHYVDVNKQLDTERKAFKYPELPQKACK